jgi:hypothetical protein
VLALKSLFTARYLMTYTKIVMVVVSRRSVRAFFLSILLAGLFAILIPAATPASAGTSDPPGCPNGQQGPPTGGTYPCPIAGGAVINGTYDPNGVAPAPGATDEEVTCDAGPGGFTWLMCGVITHSLGFIDFVRDSVIIPFLEEPAFDRDTNPEARAAYGIWSSMRNVASVFFILIFFAVIFGTAIGWDNYTIKKIIPNLVAGAILMALSWYICVIMIDIGNVLGQGLVALMSNLIPTPNIDFTTSLTTQVFGQGAGFIALAGGAYALTQISFALLVTLALGVLAVFAVLIFRKIMILMLVILSPFAFAAYVLPNTQRYFRQWYTMLTRLIMMYPIIMLSFEAGRLFASIAGAAGAVGYLVIPFASINLFGVPLQVEFAAVLEPLVPAFQLGGLYGAPVVGTVKSWGWASKGMEWGRDGIKRATGAVTKRYGKGSDIDKARQQMRQNRSLVRQADAQQRLGNVQGRGIRAQLRRAGFRSASAYHGARSGVTTMLKGDQGRIEKDEAYQKAQQTVGKYRGLRQEREDIRNGVMPAESVRGRTTAEQFAFQQQRNEGRAQRAGQLDNLGQLGRENMLATAYTGGRETARKSGADAYGKNLGIARDIPRQQLHSQEIADYAADHEEENQVKTKASITGTLATNLELDETMQGHMGVGTSLEAARMERMQRLGQKTSVDTRQSMIDHEGDIDGTVLGEEELIHREMQRLGINPATATAADRQRAQTSRLNRRLTGKTSETREAMGVNEGKIDARNNHLAAHGEQHMADIVGGSSLEERDRLAQVRALRTERVAAQASPIGHMTDDEVMRDARREASNRVATSIGARQGGLAEEAENFRQAATTGDASLAPTLSNKIIAARAKGIRTEAQAAGQRAAMVRAATNPNALSDADIVRNTNTAAQMTQDKADEELRDVNTAVAEQENRVLRNMRIDPATANESQRAAAREQIVRNIGRASGIAAGRQMNQTLNKAAGDVRGQARSIVGAQVEAEADRLQAAARAANQPLDRKVAERRAAVNVQNLTGSAARDSAAAAKQRLSDTLASTTQLTAAQAAARATNEALGTYTTQEAAIQSEVEQQVQDEARNLVEAGTFTNRAAAEAHVRAGLAAGTIASQGADRLIRTTGVAAQETAKRNEANTIGTLRSVRTAANSATNPTAGQLIDVQQRVAEVNQAVQEGQSNARYAEPKQAYSDMVQRSQNAAADKMLLERRDTEYHGDVPIADAQGNRITGKLATAQMSGDNIAIWEELVDQEFAKPREEQNLARVSAIMRKLNSTGGGQQANRRIGYKHFKRNDKQAVDPSDQELVRYYNAGVENGPDDLKISPMVSYTEQTPEGFSRQSWRELRDSLVFAADSPVVDPADREKEIREKINNIKEAIKNPQIKKNFKVAHYEQMWRWFHEYDAAKTRDLTANPKGDIIVAPGAALKEELWSQLDEATQKIIEEGHKNFSPASAEEGE